MLILVTYDVGNIDTNVGKRRLRAVAKICEKYGQRVQNSVFECYVDNNQFYLLKQELLETYNEVEDSIRIYKMGNKYKDKIEQYGCKSNYDPYGLIEV